MPTRVIPKLALLVRQTSRSGRIYQLVALATLYSIVKGQEKALCDLHYCLRWLERLVSYEVRGTVGARVT